MEPKEIKAPGNGLTGLYTRDGEYVGQLALPTGRAIIGGMFYAAERTCHRVWRKQKIRQNKATCSECGYGITDSRFNYCPKCGARITEEDE